MNLSEEKIELIAGKVHDLCRKPGTDYIWDKFLAEDKKGMYEFVLRSIMAVKLGFGEDYIHDTWVADMELKGFEYGKKKTDTTHPFLVGFKDLPPEQKMKLGILYDFTKRCIDMWEEKGMVEFYKSVE